MKTSSKFSRGMVSSSQCHNPEIRRENRARKKETVRQRAIKRMKERKLLDDRHEEFLRGKLDSKKEPAETKTVIPTGAGTEVDRAYLPQKHTNPIQKLFTRVKHWLRRGK